MLRVYYNLYEKHRLEKADLSLVELHGPHAYCVTHGAMNAVGKFFEDGCWHFIWRCVTSYCWADAEDLDKPVDQRQVNDNPCRAGCIVRVVEQEARDIC